MRACEAGCGGDEGRPVPGPGWFFSLSRSGASKVGGLVTEGRAEGRGRLLEGSASGT